MHALFPGSLDACWGFLHEHYSLAGSLTLSLYRSLTHSLTHLPPQHTQDGVLQFGLPLGACPVLVPHTSSVDDQQRRAAGHQSQLPTVEVPGSKTQGTRAASKALNVATGQGVCSMCSPCYDMLPASTLLCQSM